jgi:hypothetical protein
MLRLVCRMHKALFNNIIFLLIFLYNFYLFLISFFLSKFMIYYFFQFDPYFFSLP